MIPYPLQLRAIQFSELSFVTYEDYVPTEATTIDVQNTIEAARHGPTGVWRFQISFDLKRREGFPPPAYRIRFVAAILGDRIGPLPAGWGEKEEVNWIGSNLCGVLFGAARQAVLSATALGPNGAFVLPAVTFGQTDFAGMMKSTTEPEEPGAQQVSAARKAKPPGKAKRKS